MRYYCIGLLMAFCTIAPSQNANLIRNPGFEKGDDEPAEWELGHEGTGAGSATRVTDNPHSGKYCVRLQMNEYGNYWMARQRYQPGTAKPQRAYRISGWYRATEGVCHPTVYFLDKNGEFLGAWEATLPASESWQQFDFVFVPKPRPWHAHHDLPIDRFELQLRAHGRKGAGVCWFDDVKLQSAEAFMKRTRNAVQRLLQLAEEYPEYLWAIVSGAGHAQFQLIGSPAIDIAWLLGGSEDTDTGDGQYNIELVHRHNGRTIHRRTLTTVTDTTDLQSKTISAGAISDADTVSVVATGNTIQPSPVLLVGLKARPVSNRLVNISATPGVTPTMKQKTPVTMPWHTRVLKGSRTQWAQLRAAHRTELFRAAMDVARPGRSTAMATCWYNFTQSQWLNWLLHEHRQTHKSPIASGVRNEYLSFQVMYAPGKQPEALRATLSDLEGPAEAVISSDECQVRLVEYVPFANRWLPDPLLERQPFKPPAHGPIVFWTTIHIPRDAQPGTYRGHLNIHNAGGSKTRREFVIQVRQPVLPDKTHLQSSFWLFRGHIKQYFGIERQLPLEDYFPYIDLATSHRLSPIDVAEGPAKPLVKIYREPDGNLTCDFSRCDRYLDRMKAGGANTIHLGFGQWMGRCFSDRKAHYSHTGNIPKIIDRQTGEKISFGYEFGSEQHLDVLADYLKAAADHLRQRGEFDKCYIQVWDEPRGDGPQGLQDCYTILKALKERVPQIPRLMDAVYPATFDGKMADVVNIWCPLTSHVGEGRFKQVRKRGDTMWWYVCCGPRDGYANLFTNLQVPVMRVLFWQTWQYDINGILYWGLNFWQPWGAEPPAPDERFPNRPWTPRNPNAQTDYTGDGYLIYPGKRVDTPLSSIRLETIRDGVEDYELLHLLKKTLAANPDADPNTVARARQVLNIRPSVSKNLRQFDRDGTAMSAERKVIADLITTLSRPQ